MCCQLDYFTHSHRLWPWRWGGGWLSQSCPKAPGQGACNYSCSRVGAGIECPLTHAYQLVERVLLGKKGNLKPAQSSRCPGPHAYQVSMGRGCSREDHLKPAKGPGSLGLCAYWACGRGPKGRSSQTSREFRHPGALAHRALAGVPRREGHSKPEVPDVQVHAFTGAGEGVRRGRGCSQTSRRSQCPGALAHLRG